MRSIPILVIGLIVCSLLGGCGGTTDIGPVQEVPTQTSPPHGSQGNPVLSNSEWEPIFETIDGVEMALVPTGCFMMGNEGWRENEEPVHEQCIEEPFYIDVYEVSNRQYGNELESGEDTPVIFVNWQEASVHCDSRGGRLPTEHEWEYAARGPDNLLYPWKSERISEIYVATKSEARFYGPYPGGSWPGGASWVGALDMIGNVAEWTSSLFQDYPYTDAASVSDWRKVDESETLTVRGNSYGSRPDEDFRASYRGSGRSDKSNEYIGFRCVILK